MPVLLVGALVALFIHFGQGTTGVQETVILLPDPDGHVGKVLVRRGEASTLLDEPYEVSRASGAQETENRRLGEEEVRRQFRDVLAALPARPVSYVLYFNAGQDELTEESKAEMQRLLDDVRRRPQSDILVIGHSDRVGKDASNDALSLQRAERIKTELLSLGVAPERLRTSGRGEREPLVTTADGVEQPRNRRVEVSVR